jgi:hypothetical protein
MFAIGMGLLAFVADFAYSDPILLVIGADIGLSPHFTLVAYCLHLVRGMSNLRFSVGFQVCEYSKLVSARSRVGVHRGSSV